MTVYECPHCGTVIETSPSVRGPFSVPPRVRCYHCGEGEYCEMERIGAELIGDQERP